MKTKIFIRIIFAALCTLVFAVPAYGTGGGKRLDYSTVHSAGTIQLRVSNYGTFGMGEYPRLTYPANSGIDFMREGSIWIGARKYRRNADGIKLYWVAQVPSADSSGTVAEGDPGWNSHMKAVLDTLTSVGSDGDAYVNELLPAYNPLEGSYPLYNQYNTSDKVFSSILSNPLPRPFTYPDPDSNYCFTVPTGETGQEAGFETFTSYFYDFDPLGIVNERDWGLDRFLNDHVPLGIAIKQKSYAWPIQDYSDYIIQKYTVYNTSPIDTLFDIALGSFIDAEIHPWAWDGVSDDVSGYSIGTGYEFAYSRDRNAQSPIPDWLAAKIYIPGVETFFTSYFWRIGAGPRDNNPQIIPPTASTKANEKYWLMTNRNPRGGTSDYAKLRGGPVGNIIDYEQPFLGDTRFLLSAYGNQPTDQNPNPPQRLHLLPGENLSFYLILFMGQDIATLKEMSVRAETFINSDFDLSGTEESNSIPYVTSYHQTDIGIVSLDWFSYTDPDHYLVQYKPADAPVSEWQSINLPGQMRNTQITGLTNGLSYKFKVASIYHPGPNEVYLESHTYELMIDDANQTGEDNLPVLPLGIRNYPNPFSNSTTFLLKNSSGQQTELTIYNLKGQVVRQLVLPPTDLTEQQVFFDGKDVYGKLLSSGLYFARCKSGNRNTTHKLIIFR